MLPNTLYENKEKIYNLENYSNELKLRLNKSITNAKKLINIAKEKSKLIYDKSINISDFDIGDLVLIKLESRKKNQSPYHGPYEIIKRMGVNSTLNVNNVEKIYHNNTLKLYKKYNK